MDNLQHPLPSEAAVSLQGQAPISSYILEMRNITKAFPGVLALNNVTFECRRGEVLALVGENGAGKSTLMKILSGAYQADSGRLILRGQEVNFEHPREAQLAGISIIYQEFNLLPDRTVAQNIFLGREPRRGPLVDQARMVQETARLLENLGVRINPQTMVGMLSVAQQQEVEIAKALSLDADIIVMDEPTAALSTYEVDNLLDLVRRLRERGVTVIYITHRLEEVFKIADRVTVLKDGETVITTGCADVTRDDLVHYMVGREFSHYFPPKARQEDITDVVLKVENISTNNLLHDISFEVRRGEIVGVAGLEGSGRTELARALFGAERATHGSITLNGKPARFRSPRQAIKSGVGFITEDRKKEGLVLMLSVRNNVALPSLPARQRIGFIRMAEERSLVANYAELLDLRSVNDRQEVQFLSGGNQQKVVLAKWLATQAKLLIFDEPTRGIDVGAKAGVHQLMREIASRGVGILMISSELPEVIGMSDRVLVMHQGTIVKELPGADLTEAAIMRAATGTDATNGSQQGVSR